MGSDLRLDSLSSWEQETTLQGQETCATPERGAAPVLEGIARWVEALPWLVVLLLLLLSPVLYDLLRRLGIR